MPSTHLRIAFVATNNDRDYSGGRYHALIMACAASAQGNSVSFITNKRPVFYGELVEDTKAQIDLVIVPDFSQPIDAGKFDWVIVIPTGIYFPTFYEFAIDLAERSSGRLALVNFESGNWYNALSPTPRDPRLWDYWRRIVHGGGLTISSNRTSDGAARSFFPSGERERFEIWYPAINSGLAQPRSGEQVDIVSFLRTSDPHKGASDLLHLDPALFGGRTLHIVTGAEIDPQFEYGLKQRVQAGGGVVQIHQRISDAAKFALMARCKALLFPSRFEGFGYPPVEAAFSGVEVAAYRLPVIAEMVGRSAVLAEPKDIAGLGDSLAQALQRPDRAEQLRAEVAGKVEFGPASIRLNELLWRSLERVPVRGRRSVRIAWGPADDSPPRPASAWEAAECPLLLTAERAQRTPAGDILLPLRIDSPIERFEIGNRTRIGLIGEPLLCRYDDFSVVTLLLDPQGSVGKDIAIRIVAADGEVMETALRIYRVSDPQPSEIAVAEYRHGADSGISVRFSRAAIQVWARFSTDPECVRCPRQDDGFFLIHPAQEERDDVQILVADDDGQVIALFEGLPLSDRYRHGSFRLSEMRERAHRRIQIVAPDDAGWEAGCARSIGAGQLGRVAVQSAQDVGIGDIVRLASGRLRRVTAVQGGDGLNHLTLSGPVSPVLDGFPNSLELFPAGDLFVPLELAADAGAGFWGAVWVVSGPGCRHGLAVKAAPADIAVGSVIRLPYSGYRTVRSVQPLASGALLWLDQPISPLKDSDPRGCTICSDPLLIGHAAEARWIDGRHIGLAETALARCRIGSILGLAGGPIARVAAVHADAVTLDRDIDLPMGSQLRIDPARALLDAAALLAFPTPMPIGKLQEELVAAAWCDGLDLLPSAGVPKVRSRVMFVTPVPMVPLDQGNRVVTFRLVNHLLELGFDVDVVLQGGMDPAVFAPLLGERVRVFSVPYTVWSESDAAARRTAVLKWAEGEADAGAVERTGLAELAVAARLYHPFFTISDSLVRLAAGLYRTHHYDAILCNYTHSIRVAAELGAIRPLPPVAVITHDALSRLPLSYAGQSIDTGARLCTPEVERDVLNFVPGAVIAAISSSERHYFERIGVRNPLVLTEYDAVPELQGRSIVPENFAKRRLIFHGSGNPMNVASLVWFIEECWDRIRAACPEARLVVCGRIAKMMPKGVPGIELRPDLDRNALIEALRDASMAINPSVVGTGLKIKTVEALALGLPAVCTSVAVEGLEDDASRFAIVADGAPEFADACIALLCDEARWRGLHDGALQLAATRFDSASVYASLDRAMGWDVGIEERFLHRQADMAADGALIAPHRPGQGAVPPRQGEIAFGAAGMLLAKAGQAGAARPLLERSLLSGGGDVDQLAMAADLARGAGNPAHAAILASALVARDPANIAAYHMLSDALRAQGSRGDADAVLRQADCIAPYRSETRAVKLALHKAGQHGPLAGLEGWAPVALSLGAEAALPLAGRPAGAGWSGGEAWGQWTSERSAFLKLVLEDLPDGRESVRYSLNLRAAAAEGGAQPEQVVLIDVAGQSRTLMRLPRDGQFRHYAMPIDIASAGEPGIFVSLWIQDPAPKVTGGKIVDGRLLGVAISSLWVNPEPG